MGGCCCSSRKSRLVGTPVYYYVRSRTVVGSTFTTGLLADTGLDTSIPDTFCAPPPFPYDLLLGRPQCGDTKSIKGRISQSCLETSATCDDLGASDYKAQATSVIPSPKNSDFSKQEVCKQLVDEEEESCPICFEDYDFENPRLTTKCEHTFHLSCRVDGKER